MTLGQRIKEEREKRQWTQDYLAETLNVSRQAISKWEVGSTYPDIDRLVQISNLFDITLDSLIKGDDSLKKKHSYYQKRKGTNQCLGIYAQYWLDDGNCNYLFSHQNDYRCL